MTRSDWTGPPAVPIADRFLGSLPSRIPPEALDGVDVVAHCAGTGAPDERAAHAVNVEGTERLAAAASAAGARVFVFLSSQSATPQATSSYGRTKLEAEQRLLGMEGMRIVILRPGLVTGPGAGGLFQRMSSTVERLPIVPLLGGGRALVQPIHVDDLCGAILACDGLAEELDHTVLCLGDPTGISLSELVQQIAIAKLGRRKPTVPIPVAPVELLVRGAEALRIPLPVNSNNLKGLRAVQRMETGPDMERLGVPVRPVVEALGLTGSAAQTTSPVAEEPAGILLVGAGRVGLVHAVTLTRMSGAILAGLVDRSREAIVFLQRIGVRASGYPSVEKAVVATRADAAVIATPPVTHLQLARDCLEQGLAIMIEKPLAIREEQLADFERLPRDFPEAQIQVGYLMPLIPHVSAVLARLKQGEFGKVLGFEGYTLLSFVEGPLEGRWEVKPEVSGGGALINAGGHVLSMICEAFGDPDELESGFARVHSKDVEDSVVVDLDYGGFRGRQYVSWSIGGFPRQENQLRVRTDKGELLISGELSTFIAEDGGLTVLHSLDTDVGFNLAPDYVGAGFSTELSELRDAARLKSSVSMGVDEAAAIERVLFRAYASAKDVTTFEEKAESPDWVTTDPRFDAGASSERNELDRVIDLRDVDNDLVETFLLRSDLVGYWDGFQVFPEQIGGAPWESLSADQLNVTAPDFLTQGRALSLGRRREVLQGLGVRGALGALRAAAPQAVRDRSATFWVGALGLLGGALRKIPSGFSGGLLLHPSLADVMLALRQYDMLERMIVLCRKAHPYARVGFHTNLAAEAVGALSLLGVEIDQVSVLTSPNTLGDGSIDDISGAASGPIRVVAEVGPAPMAVQRAAAGAPNAWAHGADAVLIGAVADEFLRPRILENRKREWDLVFPGLRMPQGAPANSAS